MAYIESSRIKAFPAAYRGKDGDGVPYDPGASLTTERSLRGLSVGRMSRQSSAFWDDAGDSRSFVICLAGYLFTIPSGDFDDFLTKKFGASEDVYAGIRIQDAGSVAGQEPGTFERLVAVDAESGGEASLDNPDGTFHGLEFSSEDNPAGRWSVSLHILSKSADGWLVPESSGFVTDSSQVDNGDSGHSSLRSRLDTKAVCLTPEGREPITETGEDAFGIQHLIEPRREIMSNNYDADNKTQVSFSVGSDALAEGHKTTWASIGMYSGDVSVGGDVASDLCRWVLALEPEDAESPSNAKRATMSLAPEGDASVFTLDSRNVTIGNDGDNQALVITNGNDGEVAVKAGGGGVNITSTGDLVSQSRALHVWNGITGSGGWFADMLPGGILKLGASNIGITVEGDDPNDNFIHIQTPAIQLDSDNIRLKKEEFGVGNILTLGSSGDLESNDLTDTYVTLSQSAESISVVSQFQQGSNGKVQSVSKGNLQEADSGKVGIVSAESQTFGGLKRFKDGMSSSVAELDSGLTLNSLWASVGAMVPNGTWASFEFENNDYLFDVRMRKKSTNGAFDYHMESKWLSNSDRMATVSGVGGGAQGNNTSNWPLRIVLVGNGVSGGSNLSQVINGNVGTRYEYWPLDEETINGWF